jgi:hypothetical protein
MSVKDRNPALARRAAAAQRIRFSRLWFCREFITFLTLKRVFAPKYRSHDLH